MMNVSKIEKRLYIANCKDGFKDKLWQKLSKALDAIRTSSAIPYHMEELYRACEALCHYHFGQETYSKLYQACQAMSRVGFEKLKTEALREGPEEFLEVVYSSWMDYCKKLNLIRNIFMYLERSYMAKAVNVSPIWEMGLELFRSTTLASPIAAKVASSVISLIGKERHEEIVARALVRNVVNMMITLNVYKDCFEGAFLVTSREFYRSWGSASIARVSIPEYLFVAEQTLHAESQRADYFLIPATKNELVQAVEEELITSHVQAVMDRGFESLIAEDKPDDLGRLYRLLASVNELDVLKSRFNAYMKKYGSQLFEEEAKSISVIAEMIQFKSLMDRLIKGAFCDNAAFHYSLKEAFEHFLNIKHSKSAELIAKYLDHLLKSQHRTGSPLEEDVEVTIDKVLTAFRYVQGKDIFEAFYKKDLARRLLMKKSSSLDAEKLILTKLKAECGSGFTLKLEGMFKDMELSREVDAAFKSSLKAKENTPPLDMSTSVLTSGYWPTYPNQSELVLPAQLSKNQQAFTKFYTQKYTGRRLLWSHGLGHCIVKARLRAGPKELEVSLYQAVVLSLFSEHDVLRVKEIQSLTRLDRAELERTLLSLIVGKYPILLSSSERKILSDSDDISVNLNFTSKLYRIHVNSIQLKETPEEQTTTTEQVYQDRQYQIDAAIVRLMKASKTLTHTQLLSEIISLLKFPIQALDLKKRIDSLIDRDYLERDRENPNAYNYLA